MGHPNDGSGTNLNPANDFLQAQNFIGQNGLRFTSTTGEIITAKHSMSKDGTIPTIVYCGERSRHGNVCEACWGYRVNCSGTRIGHCSEALDAAITNGIQNQPKTVNS